MSTLIPTRPPLSSLEGFGLAGLIASSYVVTVYLSAVLAQPRAPLWRNDPQVIKARSIFASLNSLLCSLLVYLCVETRANMNEKDDDVLQQTLQLLGILDRPPLIAYLIVPILFLGPLYVTYLGERLPLQRHWSLRDDLISIFTSWQGFRNFIMAPITEEITYRATMLSIYKLAGYSKATQIWIAPCWFGLAHVHHGLEIYKIGGRTSSALRGAAAQVVFQFAFTTLFGWLCSFLFLRTSSLFVPISAHIFCNIMGVPMILSEMKEYPSRKIPILLAYITGAILFAFALYPWSYNPESIYWS